jgi:hypothetical protein
LRSPEVLRFREQRVAEVRDIVGQRHEAFVAPLAAQGHRRLLEGYIVFAKIVPQAFDPALHLGNIPRDDRLDGVELVERAFIALALAIEHGGFALEQEARSIIAQLARGAL